jgi:hypothetical protein
LPREHTPLQLELTVNKVNVIGRKLPRVLRLTHADAQNFVTGSVTPAAVARTALAKAAKGAGKLVQLAADAAAGGAAAATSAAAGAPGASAGTRALSAVLLDAVTAHSCLTSALVVLPPIVDDADTAFRAGFLRAVAAAAGTGTAGVGFPTLRRQSQPSPRAPPPRWRAHSGSLKVTFACSLPDVLFAQVTQLSAGSYHHSAALPAGSAAAAAASAPTRPGASAAAAAVAGVPVRGRRTGPRPTAASWGTALAVDVATLFDDDEDGDGFDGDTDSARVSDSITATDLVLGAGPNTMGTSASASGTEAAAAAALKPAPSAAAASGPLDGGSPGAFSLHYSFRDSQRYALPPHGARRACC